MLCIVAKLDGDGMKAVCKDRLSGKPSLVEREPVT
jgi:hypothetical protein